jgi:hypothetical protein
MPSVLATFRRRWYKNRHEPAQSRGIRQEEVIKPAVLHSSIMGVGLSSDGGWTAE